MPTTTHYTYVLECSDSTLYTGYTTNVKERIETHNSGDGAKYTRGRTPVKLRYFEQFDDKGEAMSREYELKQLRRDEKLDLINDRPIEPPEA